MQRHPCLAHYSGLLGVVCALGIGPLLGLDPGKVLGAVGHVIQALLCNALRLRFPRLAARQPRATPPAEKRCASLPGAVDISGLALDHSLAMGAGDLHIFAVFRAAAIVHRSRPL